MHDLRSIWLHYRARILTGLTVPVLGLMGPWASAGEWAVGAQLPPASAQAPGPQAPAPTPLPAVEALTLHGARHLALGQQPTVRAAQASLAAAEARLRGLEKLGITGGLLSRDLPIRRKQAELGVTIAVGALTQAEGDTVYAVTFTYLAASFAREQLAVVDDAIKRLEDVLHDMGDEEESRVFLKRDYQKVRSYLSFARGRREQAAKGVEKALAGLREAMGVCADYPLLVVDGLPYLDPLVDRCEIVRLALARRGEIVQANNAVVVVAHEVDAQMRTFLPTARTFASGSDIHAKVLPAGKYDESYSPGALGLEMPPSLVGCRKDRVNQAQQYHARTEAVADKTRNLIALEAETTFLRWEEMHDKEPHLRKAAEQAREVADSSRKDFKETLANPALPENRKVRLDTVLDNGIRATQFRLEANEARYQKLIALAGLERVTAGGFCAGFVAPPATAPHAPSGK